MALRFFEEGGQTPALTPGEGACVANRCFVVYAAKRYGPPQVNSDEVDTFEFSYFTPGMIGRYE